MADEDQQDSTARLEPPRLFGRKKGRKASDPAPPQESAPEPAPEPTPEPEPTPDPADVESTQVIEPEPAPEVDDTLVEAVPVASAPATPAPAAPAPPEEEAPPLFADEVPPVAAAAPAVKEPRPAKEPKAPRAPKAPKAAKEPKEPRPPREPLPGRVAAALTGLVVGLALVGATAATLRGCEAVQNTATCGGAGFPLLLAIVVLMIVLGSVLLRTLRVPDPGSTSFLAVGVVSVVALLFFIEVIESWWMIIAIPAVSVASYLLSHWVTTTFIEPAEH